MLLKLSRFLLDLLGKPLDPDSTYLYYICPFCAKMGKIKKKFSINRDTYQWKCWVCNLRGNNLYSLLRKLGKWHLKLRLTTLNIKETLNSNLNSVPSLLYLSLPKLFIPLSSNRLFLLKPKAIKYLKRRNIRDYLIKKFNIGVCQSGRYQNRIIIPSYNLEGKLNYFTGRSMDPLLDLKYLNPKCHKDSIIVFLNMINWNFPVILTLGMFDAITVNFNSIPLMGKTISNKLLLKMVYYDALVIVSLDNDALESQLKIVNKLNNIGLYLVYYVNLNLKDPNLLGRRQYWLFLLNNKKKFTISSSLDLLKQKIGKIYK